MDGTISDRMIHKVVQSTGTPKTSHEGWLTFIISLYFLPHLVAPLERGTNYGRSDEIA
jgi:hypothetical protein